MNGTVQRTASKTSINLEDYPVWIADGNLRDEMVRNRAIQSTFAELDDKSRYNVCLIPLKGDHEFHSGRLIGDISKLLIDLDPKFDTVYVSEAARGGR